MSENSFKSIRNGVIASVIGGILLWAIFEMWEHVFSFVFWLWSGVVWCWEFLFTSYSLQGWILLLLFIFALIGFAGISYSLYLNLKDKAEPEFKSYIEDFIHGVKWRWYWSGNKISNLWCFCSCCDATLVYSDQHSRNDYYGNNNTDFICENCNHNIVTSIKGDKDYVIGLIEREIHRRVRTGEYKKSPNKIIKA